MRHAATMLSRFVKTATLTSILCLAPLLIDVRSASADVVLQGDTLIVIGTDDDDELYIIGVEGHSGIMTVQLNDEPMALHVGVHHVFVDLQGGDNYVAVFQVHVEGNVTIVGGDDVTLGSPDYLPNVIWGDFTTSNDAVEVVAVDETWIVGNATFDIGDGGGHVHIGHEYTVPSELGVVILGDLSITIGDGADHVQNAVWMTRTWVDGHTTIQSGVAPEIVHLGTLDCHVVFVEGLSVDLGNGRDGMTVHNSEVFGDTLLLMGAGDDYLELGHLSSHGGFSRFHGTFTADGGRGTDALSNDTENEFAVKPSITQFEERGAR